MVTPVPLPSEDQSFPDLLSAPSAANARPVGALPAATPEVTTTFADLAAAAETLPIKRHTKVRGDANPFDPAWFAYFRRRSYGC